jgi:hypothetical protein
MESNRRTFLASLASLASLPLVPKSKAIEPSSYTTVSAFFDEDIVVESIDDKWSGKLETFEIELAEDVATARYITADDQGRGINWQPGLGRQIYGIAMESKTRGQMALVCCAVPLLGVCKEAVAKLSPVGS